MAEGQRSQPGVEVIYIFHGLSIEAAGMDQDVARRQFQPAMEAVCVANAHNA